MSGLSPRLKEKGLTRESVSIYMCVHVNIYTCCMCVWYLFVSNGVHRHIVDEIWVLILILSRDRDLSTTCNMCTKWFAWLYSNINSYFKSSWKKFAASVCASHIISSYLHTVYLPEFGDPLKLKQTRHCSSCDKVGLPCALWLRRET